MSTIERRSDPKPLPGQSWWSSIQHLLDRLTGRTSAWSFRRRRVKSFVAVVLAVLAVAQTATWLDNRLLNSGVMTGFALMTSLLLLVAIGARRRLPVLPLGSMATWTQIHLYTGLFAIGVFALHVPATWSRGPLISGWLEGTLAWLFWLVAGSGLYGWIACRRLPAKLTNLQPQVRFDQIDWHRSQIRDTAFRCIDQLQSPDAKKVLGDFYDGYLERYFTRDPSIYRLIIPYSMKRRRLLVGLRDIERYLGDEGRYAVGQLSGLIRRREDLDTQTALQLRLRGWVLCHAVLSMTLLILAIVHGIVALEFLGA